MTQPKALYLADVLEYIPDNINKAAAAELRRLHAECEHHKAWVAHITAENKSLEAQRDALLEALKLALSSHGVMLMSDPPQDAWKVNRVEERARAAIKQAEGVNDD